MSVLRRGFALVCVALLGGAASAATIYVDGASGADGNDGRSEAAALQSIQAAVDAAMAGDVVLVAPGEYGAFDTQGRDVTIRSTAGAARTKIRGGDRLMGLGYATAANLISDAISSQIGDSEDDGGTYRYDVADEWRTWRPADLPGSTLEGFTVEVTSLPNGVYSLDGNVYAVVGGRVRRCRFVCADGLAGGFAHLSLSVAENCLFVSGTLEEEVVADCSLRNCTVYTGAYLCGSELLNTIVSARSKNVYLDEGVRPPVSNCVFFGVKGVSGRSGITVADPLFVDAANGDFHLQKGSPCINAGAASYALAETDLDGNPRVANGRVDVGCYEYGESASPSEPGEGGLAESYGPFVPGAQVSIDVPALVGYKAKGLPAGLKLDAKAGKIVGAAKKGDVTATATFTKRGAPALTAQFAVGPVPAVSAALAGDAEGCRVTGAGKAYLAGKRVTLAAKAPKGTAFAGWTRDGAPWPDASASRQAKLSFLMPEGDVSLVAAFERERMSVACPVLASASLSVGVAGDAGGYPLEIETQSGVKSAKARGLPAGMKLAKDRETGAWRVVGAPTRAGSYEVELTATAASGAQEKASFAVEVAPLPAWAVGTFGGEVDRPNADAEDESDEWRKYGTVTLKVSSAGKVTAKVLAGGRAWSFSAAGFAAHDAARDAYRFRMETRAGDVFEGEILRDCHDVAALMGERWRDGGIDPGGTFAPAGREPYHVIVWRNENGRDGRLDADATGRAQTALDAVKAAGRFALADVDPAWGTVAVTVDAKGNVKASGTTADGVKVSASGGFLALDDADPYMCASLVFHDRKTGLVYDCSPSWQPLFDAEGNLVGSAGDWVGPVHCDPYPFE